jgi:hypothetical protein
MIHKFAAAVVVLSACAPDLEVDDVDLELVGLDESMEQEEGARGSDALIRLTGAGDIARCDYDGDQKVATLLDGISGTLFTAGDNAYTTGTLTEFQTCYEPSWGRHKARTRPSPGNHEYYSGAVGYFDYFGEAAGPRGRGYYSYRLGEWLILSLNSEVDVSENSAQVAWVKQEIAANPTKCALAYMHKPLMSSGPHGDNPHLKPLYRALYDGGVDVVVAGHDHDYERFLKVDGDGNRDERHGIRLFVVGTGGSPLYNLENQHPHSTKWQNHAHGVMRFTLYADKYYFKFMPVEGATYKDQGYRVCTNVHP